MELKEVQFTRPVINGEVLSGHGNGHSSSYPEILISDGQGPGGGSLICSITCFHWARVKIRGQKVSLDFEDRTRITVEDGVVEFAEAEPIPNGADTQNPEPKQ